jgi:hypothetical protein
MPKSGISLNLAAGLQCIGDYMRRQGSTFLKVILSIIFIASCLSGFSQDIKKDKDLNKKKPDEKKNEYTIEQSVSEKAQLNTMSFDGLAFLTGNMGCNTFLPPGKVADYFGFQYMRDIDVVGGHKMDFLTTIACNIFNILNDEQLKKLGDLANIQALIYTEFALKRFPLIKAFYRLQTGDLPKGTKELNRDEVMKYTSSLFLIDGELSYERAKVVGEVIRSFTPEQKTKIAALKFGDSGTWPVLKEDDVFDKTKYSHEAGVAMYTYVSELFSWYAGNIDADVYFCPERHATYFGSFYMKDMPAVGNADFNISTSVTGDSGEAFVAMLTDVQKAKITGLPALQKKDLDEILTVRRTISTELRKFIKGENVDKANILKLSKRYGELDGEISYFYATAFSQIGKTLTAKQKTDLIKLRNLDNYVLGNDEAFIYADKVKIPEMINTDFFFK